MNQNSWLEQGRQLYCSHQNSQFAIGDWVNVGIQAFGRIPAFDAAQQITGTKNTRNFYTRCAAVASYYQPELRFPKLSFHTYEVLARFPLSFLERFIPEVADSWRSCKQIYSLAVERYGSDPRRKRKSGKFHNVRLPENLFHSLAVRASRPDKTHLLIVQILSEWEQQQGAGKSVPPANPSDGNEVPRAETQPPAPADESTPRPQATARKKCTCKIRVQFMECKISALKSSLRATSFESEDAAANANDIFAACHGYKEQAAYCDRCKAWHLRHIYAVQAIADARQQQAEAA
jgi:hypothetical protein